MSAAHRSVWSINAEELSKKLGTVTLVDVREPEEWEESRIEGAILIPLGEVALRGVSELDKNREIVLYCAHGRRSLDALFILKAAGFDKVRSLEGGIGAWETHSSTKKS